MAPSRDAFIPQLMSTLFGVRSISPLPLWLRGTGTVLVCLFFVSTAWSTPAYAQEAPAVEPVAEQPVEQPAAVKLKAKAGEDRNVVVGRTVLFDGSGTTGPADAEYTYQWEFGDGKRASGIDATYTYEHSGRYKVTLTVTARTATDTMSDVAHVTVSVQDRLVLLLTDQSVSDEQVNDLRAYGLTQGTLVIPLRDTGVNQEFLTSQNLAQQLLKQEQDVQTSDVIILWTNGNTGLNSLIEFSRIASASSIDIESFRFVTKAIVSVNNNQSFITSARTAQSVFQSVEPRFIVVANNNILDDAIRAESPEELERSLGSTDAQYQLVTSYTARGLQQLGPFNFMSYAVNFMINHGVPIGSLFLVLMLPVLATIIAVARQMIGLKAFGIFAPTVVALSFLATGLKYGVTIFLAIIVLGTLARLIARRLRLLYLPRMAIVLSMLALAIFGMFYVGAATGKTGFIAISIFPILIMTVLTEHFVSVQIEQGLAVAVKLTIETLVLSLIGYFIADWTAFKTIVLAYPELILITFVLDFILGKFTGLRLTEYLRFRNVFKHLRHAETSK